MERTPSEPLRPAGEYPRTGTYTIAELWDQRRSLAACHAEYFPHRLDPVYRRMLSNVDAMSRTA